MSDETTYQPGDQANGYVWTGTAWLPIAQPQAPRGKSPWRILAGIVSLFAAAVAALMALSWLGSFGELEAEGNQFAGILALFGLGAAGVAVAFGVTGIVLLTKK